MALAELGGIMSRAIQQMLNATIIDEKVLNEFLDVISRALLQSDVPLDIVSVIQTDMRKILNLKGDCDKFRMIQLILFDELYRILYPGNPSFTPEKGKTSVIMFVGQGSEKTTCTKYAYYHMKKGWKPALVCANTSRDGAFDQLEQNATDAKIPFYESYTESDPVRIAVEGVERFKKENCDLIIVDTSGRHKKDASLLKKCKPDLVVFVMDSSIGHAAAFDQARAFKQNVSVGAVIITKMDGHAKGVGALSAVAATKCPVIFIGTGVLIDEFRVFDVRRFVCHTLELDNSNPMLMTKTQIIRIAQASGQLVEDVIDFLKEYKRFEETRRKMKGLKIPKKAKICADEKSTTPTEVECLVKQMGSMGSAKEI
ncbi:hypothetical protein LWI29_005776 [Acer saccharum]|uniref:signal-recognition-particle GTPase n=1 Tax=Acer saccharum TaxID=4024 RepID=A0AA39S691_ACESA|nr:hypothetical protein LWI29_005776 [Acer saccharum]